MSDNKLKIFLFIINLVLILIIYTKFNTKQKYHTGETSYDYLMYLEYSLIKSYELNGKTIPFLGKNVGKNKYSCIFVYNTKDCDVCLKREIVNISELSKKIGKNNIIILLFDDNPNYSKIFKRLNNISCKVIQMRTEFFDFFPIRSLSTPFMIVVDGNNKIINSFFPSPELPQFSSIFYKYIEKLFENRNDNGYR